MGDNATEFVGWATMSQDYLEAALTLDAVRQKRKRVSEPSLFIYHHSVELALKSYLLASGKTAADLKIIGHHFETLLNQCLKLDFRLSEEAKEFVRELPDTGGVIDVKYFKIGWARRHVAGHTKIHSVEVVVACIKQAFEKSPIEMPNWLKAELSQLQSLASCQ